MKKKLLDNIVIYYPEGRISNDLAEQFEHQLIQIITIYGDCDLILNMEDVPSIGSNGIEKLVSVARQMKNEDRIFTICCPKDLTMKIISILSVGSLITVYSTEEEAVGELLLDVACV